MSYHANGIALALADSGGASSSGIKLGPQHRESCSTRGRQPRRPTMRTSAAHDDSFLAAFSVGVLANPRHADKPSTGRQTLRH
jgi:hypothetical protein